MIKPTPGRIVWFFPHSDEGFKPGDQPHAAIVAHVLDDDLINIAVFSATGALYSRQAVPLLQDDAPAPAGGHFAAWMPYQKGQAAKAEATTAAAAVATTSPLTDLHSKLDELEKGFHDKLQQMGEWTIGTLRGFETRLTGIEASATIPEEASTTDGPTLAPEAPPAPDASQAAPEAAQAAAETTAGETTAAPAQPAAAVTQAAT